VSEVIEQPLQGSLRDALSPSALNPNPGFFERDDGRPVPGPDFLYVVNDTTNPNRLPVHWTRRFHYPETQGPTVTVYNVRKPNFGEDQYAPSLTQTLPPGDYNFLRVSGGEIVSQAFSVQRSGTYKLSFYIGRMPRNYTSMFDVGVFSQNGIPIYKNLFSNNAPSFSPVEVSISLAAGMYYISADWKGGAGACIALPQLTPQVSLTIVSGDEQAAFVGDPRFPQDLQVRATLYGEAHVGAPVTFTVRDSNKAAFDGNSQTITRTTDGSGATVPAGLIPKDQTGTFQVTASCPGAPDATFHLAVVPARSSFSFSSDPEHIEVRRGSFQDIRVRLQSRGSSWPYVRIQGSLLQVNAPPVFFFGQNNGPRDFPPMLPNAGNDYLVRVYASDDTGDHDGQLYVQVSPDLNNQGPRQVFPMLRTDPRA
jgi:hypothetical protein